MYTLHNAKYQTCHGDLWNISNICYHATIEAAKILDWLEIFIMNIQKFTNYTKIIEDEINNKLTIPTIFSGKSGDWGRKESYCIITVTGA